MKLLYFHAQNLRIESGVDHLRLCKQRQMKRKLIEKLGMTLPVLEGGNVVRTESYNALLAFVCVEKGDEKVRLWEVRDDILKARALIGVADIVVGAFGHLSNKVAVASVAREIVDQLVIMVTELHPATKTFPFGWDKSLELYVPLHHYNVSFKSFEPSD